MTRILDLVEKIQDTQASISKLEKVAIENPESKSLALTIRSLYHREEDLQKSFSAVAAEDLVDVCSYRLAADNSAPYNVSTVSKVLGDFQNLLTIVFDAIKNNTQKQRADITPEIAKQSSLEFGYTFSGSLGFVFTIPNERLLAVDSDLDLSIQAIFEMAKAQDSKALSIFAKKIGIAPIRSVYRWAKDHVESSLSAEIQWERGDEVRASLLIQPPELRHLITVIDETSDEERTPFSIYGQLVGADTDMRTFHLKVEGGKDIKGSLDENFRPPENFAIDQYYMAEMVKKTKVHYSTDKKDEVYLLISLGKYPPDNPS